MSFAEDTNAGAGERKEENDNDDDESKNNTAAAVATPMRKVFENANRGNWPGDGKVSQISLLRSDLRGIRCARMCIDHERGRRTPRT